MEIMITITGIQHHMDVEELNPNQPIVLEKEPTNQYDTEAIAVYTSEHKQIGYVAKSLYTQAKGTYSAGRLYDKIGDTCLAKILVILHHSAIALVDIEG